MWNEPPSARTGINRRQMLRRFGAGFGALSLAALLGDDSRAGTPELSSESAGKNPLSRREPHFPGRAKRVIFLFMPGGPSQVDTFDPKPRLNKEDGRPAQSCTWASSVRYSARLGSSVRMASPESRSASCFLIRRQRSTISV